MSSARVSSQRLNLPFQWMLNLSVEKGFRVTAQSLLPVERTFARGMDRSIIRLAQGEGREGIATYGLAGLPIPQLVQCPNQNTPCEQGVFWFGLK